MRDLRQIYMLFALVAGVMLIVGCGRVERDYHVRIVVPDGYVGLVKIIFRKDGIHVPVKEGERQFIVPESGVLVVNGPNPFVRLGTASAEFSSGGGIPSANQLLAEGKEVNASATLLRLIGNTNDAGEFWAVVGSQKEWESANLKLHNHISKSVKGSK